MKDHPVGQVQVLKLEPEPRAELVDGNLVQPRLIVEFVPPLAARQEPKTQTLRTVGTGIRSSQIRSSARILIRALLVVNER